MDYRFPIYVSSKELDQFADFFTHQDENGQLPHQLADHYERYRKEICAQQILQNIAGRPAPYFRAMPRARPHIDKSMVYRDAVLSNDQQVVDLHWLWAQRRDEVSPTDPRFEQLFANEMCFDFDLASNLIKTVGKGQLKAELLQIAEAVEMELNSLVTSEVRKYRKGVETERAKAVRRIRDSSTKLQSADIREWADYFVVLRMAKGDTSIALRFYQTMVGTPSWGSRDSAIRQMATKRRKLEQDYLGINRSDWGKQGLL